MTKRSKLDIVKDILKIIQQQRSIKITPLIRKSNLSTARFQHYYEDLITKNLVVEQQTPPGKTIHLTEKGYRFLEKYQAIRNFIEEFEL